METNEQDSPNIDGSYQCNFVLLSRKMKDKEADEVSGQNSKEGSSSAEKMS
jgi:hypothetical protein